MRVARRMYVRNRLIVQSLPLYDNARSFPEVSTEARLASLVETACLD